MQDEEGVAKRHAAAEESKAQLHGHHGRPQGAHELENEGGEQSQAQQVHGRQAMGLARLLDATVLRSQTARRPQGLETLNGLQEARCQRLEVSPLARSASMGRRCDQPREERNQWTGDDEDEPRQRIDQVVASRINKGTSTARSRCGTYCASHGSSASMPPVSVWTTSPERSEASGTGPPERTSRTARRRRRRRTALEKRRAKISCPPVIAALAMARKTNATRRGAISQTPAARTKSAVHRPGEQRRLEYGQSPGEKAKDDAKARGRAGEGPAASTNAGEEAHVCDIQEEPTPPAPFVSGDRRRRFNTRASSRP